LFIVSHGHWDGNWTLINWARENYNAISQLLIDSSAVLSNSDANGVRGNADVLGVTYTICMHSVKMKKKTTHLLTLSRFLFRRTFYTIKSSRNSSRASKAVRGLMYLRWSLTNS
jgi:hypothetical protein